MVEKVIAFTEQEGKIKQIINRDGEIIVQETDLEGF